MNVLTVAFWQLLTSDPIIADRLAQYPAGSGTPAVFTDDRVPGNAQLPYIVTSGEVANEPGDTKNSRGRRPFRDVYIYGDHQSTSLVEQVADRIHALFHRQNINVDGYRTVVCTAHGPVRLSSEDYDARIVSVRMWLDQEDEESS